MNTSHHRVIIYHDETKDVPGQNCVGHVLLFVPIRIVLKSETPLLGIYQDEYYPQEMLFRELIRRREKYNCDGKLHFSELSGQTWNKYDFAYREASSIAIDALRNKSPEIFSRPLNCKVAVIFYPKGADWNIYGGESRKEQKLRHHETLLRILLKGACHFLYDDTNPVEIARIISDGFPDHRQLDDERVVWRLTYDDLLGKTPLREYVTLSSDATITHISSDHKKYQPDSEEIKQAHFLQIADLLLGAIMRACYVKSKPSKFVPRIGDKCIKKDVIAQPVRDMLEKRKRGKGFRNSGHYKAFALSLVSFGKNGIHFQEVQTFEIQDPDILQMSLPIIDDLT